MACMQIASLNHFDALVVFLGYTVFEVGDDHGEGYEWSFRI